MQIYQVGDVTRYLKNLLDGDENLSDLWVAGELSNVSRAPSGHLYFTLKDSASQLSCVMWRTQAARLVTVPRDGMRVILHGTISVYENRGVYQLYADTLQAEGIGLLAAEFEQLKARLAAEGLFAEEHKRPLPSLPRRIGIATSLTGAVLHDIVTILRRRYPLAHVVVAGTPVQGAEAPPQIIAALAGLQAAAVDVIIVARGGGSLEDLWAFNDESLARAIYASTVPVISAVGHQVDYTIADFVADVRAPTPSAAAEIVAPDVADVAARVNAWQGRLGEVVALQASQARTQLAAEERALARLSPRLVLDQQRQRVDDLWRRACSVVKNDVRMHQEQARGLSTHLQALSPMSILDRGFAIIWRRDGADVVSSVKQVQPGEQIQVQVHDGRFGAVVGGDTRRRRLAPDEDGGQLALEL
jgi:exodeoxyribonuclease VII large subunit